MKVYNWSPEKIIAMANIGNLEFDEKGFLKAYGASTASRSTKSAKSKKAT